MFVVFVAFCVGIGHCDGLIISFRGVLPSDVCVSNCGRSRNRWPRPDLDCCDRERERGGGDNTWSVPITIVLILNRPHSPVTSS